MGADVAGAVEDHDLERHELVFRRVEPDQLFAGVPEVVGGHVALGRRDRESSAPVTGCTLSSSSRIAISRPASRGSDPPSGGTARGVARQAAPAVVETLTFASAGGPTFPAPSTARTATSTSFPAASPRSRRCMVTRSPAFLARGIIHRGASSTVDRHREPGRARRALVARRQPRDPGLAGREGRRSPSGSRSAPRAESDLRGRGRC